MSIYFVNDINNDEPNDFQDEYEIYLDQLDARNEIKFKLDDELEV